MWTALGLGAMSPSLSGDIDARGYLKLMHSSIEKLTITWMRET